MTNRLPFGVMIKIVSNALDSANISSLKAMELTGSQSFILNWLCEHRDSRICQRDIEQRFNLRHPTVCGILRRLEKNDFIEICPDEEDRRQKLILVKEKALIEKQQIDSILLSNEDAILEGLSEQEQEALLSALEKIVSNIKNPCCSQGGTASRNHNCIKEVNE
ncbi:MAG: MarR family transcriptional regulator [Oscillospiraceae bacterium]|nr:MarR family transcriptional regulator [Oscillospiraceae bacterium]